MKRRGNNKGQVTIFIIIAVVIIAIIALFFVFRGKFFPEESSVETSPIYVHVLSCLESTTEEGIEYIALRGGFYNIPEEVYFSYLADEDSYYYIHSIRRIPSIESIESELENYIKDNLKICLDIKSLEEEGYEVTLGELLVDLTVKDEEVDAEATYPITLKKGDYTSRFKDFEVEVDSNVNRIYTASEEIVNSYSLKPGFVCMTCLEDISYNYDVTIKSTVLADEEVIWFSVFDSESELNWRFVVEQ